MGKKESKSDEVQMVYLPLMMGDWIKGTRGMRADVKGVYIGLLIHQYDQGYIPSDIYELELIEPEVNKVWDKIKDKFIEVSPGKLQNKKLEKVRDFWNKQRKNGKKGGRPKNNNPKLNPDHNPKTNPNNNLNNDLDLDNNNSGFKYSFKESPDFSKPDIDGDEIIFPLDTSLMRDLWSGWKKYRFEAHNARYGIMGEQADLKRLQNMTFEHIEETILKAISGNWKNLYPEKSNGKTTHNSTNKKQQQSDDTSAYLKDYYTAKASSSQAN